MKAIYRDAYGCTASLIQYIDRETTRLSICDAHGDLIHRKEYKTWRGARIALGKWGDSWKTDDRLWASFADKKEV